MTRSPGWLAVATAKSTMCELLRIGSETLLLFQIKEGAYNTESLIEFLTDLHEHFDGAKVTLIWDGLPSHPRRR